MLTLNGISRTRSFSRWRHPEFIAVVKWFHNKIVPFNFHASQTQSSLRSKRFQSSYCAKVRAEAKKKVEGGGLGLGLAFSTNLARKRLPRRLDTEPRSTTLDLRFNENKHAHQLQNQFGETYDPKITWNWDWYLQRPEVFILSTLRWKLPGKKKNLALRISWVSACDLIG